jgi:hypothetical protein
VQAELWPAVAAAVDVAERSALRDPPQPIAIDAMLEPMKTRPMRAVFSIMKPLLRKRWATTGAASEPAERPDARR